MVYIDDFNAGFGRMKMCHMIADTTEDLLQMADKIGVQRKWLQYPGTAREHFDICLSKKKLAIAYGAVEVSDRVGAAMVNARAKRLKAGSNFAADQGNIYIPEPDEYINKLLERYPASAAHYRKFIEGLNNSKAV